MIANRLQITLIKTKVKAIANVDVRGTLMINKNVPVAFQHMGLELEITVSSTVQNELADKLIKNDKASHPIDRSQISDR